MTILPDERPAPPDVLQAFGLPADAAIERWGRGHIHQTFRATPPASSGGRSVVLQRVNEAVFPDPEATTETIRRVTEHLRTKREAAGGDDGERRVLRLLGAQDGRHVVRAGDGGAWRAFAFVEGATTHQVVASPSMAAQAAYAFGTFQRDLADLPPPRLPETLPRFHDTPHRLASLERALAADALRRAAEAKAEIDLALSRRRIAPVLQRAHATGEVPERVVHNDTKLDNLLFDDVTGEPLCVIDLDTVIPGLGLHDFGDLVRTTCCPAPEDETDLDRIHAEPELYAAVTDGWLAATGDLLTPAERDLLPLAARVITYELALRFLTDHLDGDRYFRIHRPGQNLDRARAQLALLRSLEAHERTFRRLTG